MRMRRRGLVRTMATTAVIAGTATAVSGAVHNKQNQKAMQQQADMNADAIAQQQAAAAQYQPAPAAAPAQPDYMAELEKLGQLKTQGLITDEEFAAKKKQLLGI